MCRLYYYIVFYHSISHYIQGCSLIGMMAGGWAQDGPSVHAQYTILYCYNDYYDIIDISYDSNIISSIMYVCVYIYIYIYVYTHILSVYTYYMFRSRDFNSQDFKLRVSISISYPSTELCVKP